MSKKTTRTPSKRASTKSKVASPPAAKGELDQILAKFVKYVPAQLLTK